MAVDTLHPQYAQMRETWERNLDAIAGERAIKARPTRYLPIPNPEQTKADSDRYRSYLQRAVFTNFTGRTVRALTGAVFRQPPAVELPSQLEYLFDDADRAGTTLYTIAQRAVSNVLAAGRYIAVADFPEAPINATAEDTAAMSAYLACYPATALINWHETQGKLDLVVLREYIEEPHASGFDFDLVDYYRVFRLRDGLVTLQLYRETQPQSDEIELVAGGDRLTEIPVAIMGAEDNNPDADTPPISDIAALNVAHYRNSADYEEGVFMHGQPWPHVDTGDMNAAQFKETNPNIQVGSRAAVVTQGGGTISLVQMEPNSAAMEAMTHKEDQMVRLGAQIITSSAGNETAEAARIRSGAETSVLNTLVRNVSEGFEKVLRICAQYEGANPDDIEFSLNDKFAATQADAQMMAQLWMGVDRGAWGTSVPREYARRSGIIDANTTDEDLDREVVTASPV